MWKFLNSGRTKKSGVLTVMSSCQFSSGTGNQTHLQRSVEGPGQKLIIIVCDWETLKGHYDIIALSDFSTGDGGLKFLIPNMGMYVQTIPKLLTLFWTI